MTQEQNVKTNEDLYNEAWKMLMTYGLSLSERNKVRHSFALWGKEFLNDVEKDHKNDYYFSKKPELKGLAFKTEAEVKFLNALHEFSPNTKRDDLLQVMSIIMKLLDFESDWAFKTK